MIRFECNALCLAAVIICSGEKTQTGEIWLIDYDDYNHPTGKKIFVCRVTVNE
jgi:hypothetical protein